MTHIDAFAINGTTVALNDDSYTEKRGYAEYVKQTEAGTTRRDVVRLGYLAELSAKITTDGTVKAVLEAASEEASLTVTLWSDAASAATTWVCYISDFTASLIRDTATETLWSLSFTFKDLEAS